MISNFKLFPYFNISQDCVQNVQKQKKTSVLSWQRLHGLRGFSLIEHTMASTPNDF